MIASMMRAAALAVLCVAGVASGAVAQQPAPAAPAAQISPSHTAAARELALTMKIDEPLRAVLDELQAQIMSLTTTRPELAVDLKQVFAGLNAEMAAKRDEMLNVGIRAFAVRFSEAELTDLVKFLKTPLGDKFLKQQPLAFSEYLGQVQTWVTSMNEFALRRVREEMKKKGHDL